MKRGETWPAGAVVSRRGGRVLGKVRVFNRQSDGRPYRKIEITSGGPVGAWEWPDLWILGAGAHEVLCLACDEPFRSDDARAPLCLLCDARPTYDPDARSFRESRALLRAPHRPTGRQDAETKADHD